MSEELRARVEGIAKKFCRGLGRSLRYGVADIANELRPWKPESPIDLREGEFWALHDISFELKRGEALGVLGANGAGKSTLLKLLDGLLKPDKGRITLRGRVRALIDLGAGFNPILSGRENIYINAAVLGLEKRETERIIDEIVEFAAIGDAIDAPVRSYSTGMGMRLGFAVATHLRPDVLLVDEVLAVGDLAFRQKCLRHIQWYLRNGGSLVFVSHDPWMVQCICGRGMVLEQGRSNFSGSAVAAIQRYFQLQLGGGRSPMDGESQSEVNRYFSGLQRMAGMPGDVELTHDRSLGSSPSEPLENPCGSVPGLSDEAAAIDGAGDRIELCEEHPIAIDRVAIMPLSGKRVESGKDVRIVVHYRSQREIEKLFWGFLIYTRDQLNCITAEGSGFSFSDLSFRAVRGQGRFQCLVPRLPLVAGSYILKAIIGDSVTGTLYSDLGFSSPNTAFSVYTNADERSNVYAAAQCLVTMDVCWEG